MTCGPQVALVLPRNSMLLLCDETLSQIPYAKVYCSTRTSRSIVHNRPDALTTLLAVRL